MEFDLDEAVKIANQALSLKFNRSLTDIEVIVLKGAWHRQEYDEIAAKHQYATSYISQDVAPKLWKTLSEVFGEKMKKSNFKHVIEQYWLTKTVTEPSWDTIISSEEITGESDNLIFPSTRKNELSTFDLYVRRSPLETTCYKTLLQPGSLVRIKASRLMGKTFLITKVLTLLAAQGYRTANLSFKLTDSKTHLTDLDKFLRWLCINISRELGLPNQLEEYWDEEDMGSKVSCTTYFEEYLLPSGDSPLTLCLDDVDLLFPHPEIYEDFFGLLRSWYEKARSRKSWKKLRLVIVHSTDVYIRLNINQSPFNVGLPIELSEFTSLQVQEFAKQHKLEPDMNLLEPLMNLVGGHPYLLDLAFSHLKSYPETQLEQLLADAPTEAGIYASHLRENWLQLESHPQLAAAFKKVVNSTEAVQLQPMEAYQLQSMGLVKLSGNHVQPRCNLYRQYFCQNLFPFQ